jgi:hypothetical protein
MYQEVKKGVQFDEVDSEIDESEEEVIVKKNRISQDDA